MKTTEEPEWKYFGPHAVRFEPPDVVYSRPVGEISGEQSAAVWAFVREVMRPEGIYWLADISKLTRYSSAALSSKDVVPMHLLHCYAAFGANFFQRTLMTGIVRASRALAWTEPRTKLAFFKDEASARAWIAELRAKGKAR